MKRAFSILEVLIATAVVACGLLAMIGVYAAALRQQAQGRDVVAGTDLARTLIDRVRAEPSKVRAGTFDGTPPVDGFPPKPYPVAQVEGREYRLRVTVVAGPGPRSLLVEVFWGGEGRTRLETLVP